MGSLSFSLRVDCAEGWLSSYHKTVDLHGIKTAPTKFILLPLEQCLDFSRQFFFLVREVRSLFNREEQSIFCVEEHRWLVGLLLPHGQLWGLL